MVEEELLALEITKRLKLRLIPKLLAFAGLQEKVLGRICFNPAKAREDTWEVASGSIPRDKAPGEGS